METGEINDYEVIRAMRIYGGGFASALAEAARYADDNNLRRIKETWPEYWFEYSAMVKVLREKDACSTSS